MSDCAHSLGGWIELLVESDRYQLGVHSISKVGFVGLSRGHCTLAYPFKVWKGISYTVFEETQEDVSEGVSSHFGGIGIGITYSDVKWIVFLGKDVSNEL
ncbi:hypothetical protein Lser_V15G03716 [Lactuca serriola]